MEVTELIEHEDGGATYQFDMNAEEHDAMCRNGITWAIVCGVTGLTVQKALQDYMESENSGDSSGDVSTVSAPLDE